MNKIPLMCWWTTPSRPEIFVCVCVSVCVCLFAIISSELHVRSSLIFMNVAYRRDSVLLWRRSDTLCTSGFMDDAIFVRSNTIVAGRRMHGTTFRALKVHCNRGVHGNGGKLGSHGSHGIPMGMGVRSAMGWEWDGNGN